MPQGIVLYPDAVATRKDRSRGFPTETDSFSLEGESKSKIHPSLMTSNVTSSRGHLCSVASFSETSLTSPLMALFERVTEEPNSISAMRAWQ